MSLYRIETSAGSISITKNVIGRIIIESVRKFNGKIIISNHKGKVRVPKRRGDGSDIINNIDIVMGAKGLDIRLYVVMKFGTSIGTAIDGLIKAIYDDALAMTGLAPNSVAIVVTGMISKDQMTRRNIEVKRQ